MSDNFNQLLIKEYDDILWTDYNNKPIIGDSDPLFSSYSSIPVKDYGSENETSENWRIGLTDDNINNQLNDAILNNDLNNNNFMENEPSFEANSQLNESFIDETEVSKTIENHSEDSFVENNDNSFEDQLYSAGTSAHPSNSSNILTSNGEPDPKPKRKRGRPTKNRTKKEQTEATKTINKNSAKRYRKRQNQNQEQLEINVKQLSKENMRLKEEIESQETEINGYKQQLKEKFKFNDEMLDTFLEKYSNCDTFVVV